MKRLAFVALLGFMSAASAHEGYEDRMIMGSMLGGAIGAVIGNDAGGRDGAILGSAIGAATGTVLLTPNERRVAEDRRDCFWLYVVTSCKTTPMLQEPIRDPARFPWHEVTKVEHYWLDINAMTKPMRVSEKAVPPYAGQDGP